MMYKNLFIVCFFIFLNKSYGQEGYPSPSSKENLLFYIQHDRGHNTYVYKANLSKAKSFHHRDPVRIYRELFDEEGQTKPLTKIQSAFAYGIKTTPVHDNKYNSYIVSLPDQKIDILLDKNKTPIAETVVNGKKIILQRIFLKQTEGTSGMSTKLDYILFYGKNTQGGNVVEKLTL